MYMQPKTFVAQIRQTDTTLYNWFREAVVYNTVTTFEIDFTLRCNNRVINVRNSIIPFVSV